MNWLSSDEDLISIRPKAQEDRTHHDDARADERGAHHQPVCFAADCDFCGRVGLVAASLARARQFFSMLETTTRTPSMKSTGLLIAAALLAALTGVLYWSNHHAAEDTTKPATPAAAKLRDASKTLTSAKSKSIRREPSTSDLAKGSDGKWEITAPQKLTGDQDAITGVISVIWRAQFGSRCRRSRDRFEAIRTRRSVGEDRSHSERRKVAKASAGR